MHLWHIAGLDRHLKADTAIGVHKLSDRRPGKSSVEVCQRVEIACEQQQVRFAETKTASNTDMRPAQIRKYCVLDEACQALMKTPMSQLQLTARAYHQILKLSRTIADLVMSELISRVRLAEAPLYRLKLELM